MVLDPEEPELAPHDWPRGQIGIVDGLSETNGVFRFAVGLESNRTSTGIEVWMFSQSEILVLEHPPESDS
jgi:hypothetical protein